MHATTTESFHLFISIHLPSAQVIKVKRKILICTKLAMHPLFASHKPNINHYEQLPSQYYKQCTKHVTRGKNYGSSTGSIATHYTAEVTLIYKDSRLFDRFSVE